MCQKTKKHKNSQPHIIILNLENHIFFISKSQYQQQLYSITMKKNISCDKILEAPLVYSTETEAEAHVEIQRTKPTHSYQKVHTTNNNEK